MSNEIASIGQPIPAASTGLAAPSPVQQAGPAATADGTKPAPPAEKTKFEPTLNLEEMRANLREAIERLNEMMRKNGRELNFSMDESIDRVVITVKNSQTGEIVRQIPDAAAMRVAHNLESLKGVLHNESI